MRNLGPLFLLFVLSIGLAGCGAGLGSSSPASAVATHLTGNVHGGQQPIVGAQLYLYAVSTSNGGTATSLLNTPGFVLTGLSGEFSITGDYTCPTGAYVYLLAIGGDPGLGSGVNNEIALASGLGPCSALTSSTFVTVNEVTTVAFAFAMSAYATTDTQIGTTANLATPFAYITTLLDPTSGLARASHDGFTLPQLQLNALANAIASCINSNGIGAPCSTLMTASNASPANTFQAALNIARNPAANASTIYALSTPQAVFQPALSGPPANWTLAATSPTGQIVADANTYAFTTPVGTMCVEMRPDAAPLTVANFRYYVNNGYYANNMFIHRSVPNFVIQGGGYKFDGTNVTQATTTSPVVNEFNLSNVRGTIAMAKLGNDPNSATDQWFFNTVDNSANLNVTNGGFTVFGSIVGVSGYTSGGCASTSAGLAVMDAINTLPITNQGTTFDSLPVINYTSGPIKISNLVITTVSPANPQ